MDEVSYNIVGRVRNGLQPAIRLLKSDFVRLFVITILVMMYSMVFRESRGLGARVFASPWMLPAAAFTTWGKLMGCLSLITAIVLWNSRWQSGNRSGIPDVRIIIFPAILVLAWPFSVYEYNYFLDQAHLADRAGIMALALLCVWRPMFLGLFILQLGVVLGQLSFPLTFSWTDKSPLIDVLLLSQIYVVGARMRWWRANHFLWASIWILAVHYLRPGIGKLELGWLQRNEIANLVQGAIHQNGWLCFGLDDGLRAGIVSWVTVLSPVLMLAALLVELFPLIYFSGRKVLLLGLSSAIMMHLAIFASSGIFFWKWIVLDMALIVAILQMPEYTNQRLFQIRHHVVFCLFLVPGSLIYATAPKLAWFDAPLCQRYHIEIVGNSGRIYQVPPSELAPFDLQFAQGRLFFADSDPMVIDCFGSCAALRVLESTESIRSESDLQRIQASIGQKRYDARLTGMLASLLTSFVQQPPEVRMVPFFGMLPDPPQHIWTFPATDVTQERWEWQEPAKEIRIRKLMVSHLDGKKSPIQEKTILEIKVE